VTKLEILKISVNRVENFNEKIKYLKAIADGNVSFSYKDYAHGAVTKLMTLEVDEFLRRFCLHILPPKFVKMRHYGFLSSRAKQKLKIEQNRKKRLQRNHQKSTWFRCRSMRLLQKRSHDYRDAIYGQCTTKQINDKRKKQINSTL